MIVVTARMTTEVKVRAVVLILEIVVECTHDESLKEAECVQMTAVVTTNGVVVVFVEKTESVYIFVWEYVVGDKMRMKRCGNMANDQSAHFLLLAILPVVMVDVRDVFHFVVSPVVLILMTIKAVMKIHFEIEGAMCTTTVMTMLVMAMVKMISQQSWMRVWT
jgi:hypothetical protein